MSNETKRDLAADLAICNAATAGPWYVLNAPVNDQPDGYSFEVCLPDMFDTVMSATNLEENAAFIAEARTGWPHAIERALAAEAKLERAIEIIRWYHELHWREGGRRIMNDNTRESNAQGAAVAYWRRRALDAERELAEQRAKNAHLSYRLAAWRTSSVQAENERLRSALESVEDYVEGMGLLIVQEALRNDEAEN